MARIRSLVGICPVKQVGKDETYHLSDERLLELVKTNPLNCKELSGKIGTHKGLPVYAFYGCEDLCPEYASIEVYYDGITNRKDCKNIGGHMIPRFNLDTGEVYNEYCSPINPFDY